jgi:hypothetical protein
LGQTLGCDRKERGFSWGSGTRGQPSFYELNGKIEAAGTASLRCDEITGSQKWNFSDGKKGPPGKGTHYTYEISAHFGERQGTGKSTSDNRARVFTFVKQG